MQWVKCLTLMDFCLGHFEAQKNNWLKPDWGAHGVGSLGRGTYPVNLRTSVSSQHSWAWLLLPVTLYWEVETGDSWELSGSRPSWNSKLSCQWKALSKDNQTSNRRYPPNDICLPSACAHKCSCGHTHMQAPCGNIFPSLLSFCPAPPVSVSLFLS